MTNSDPDDNIGSDSDDEIDCDSEDDVGSDSEDDNGSDSEGDTGSDSDDDTGSDSDSDSDNTSSHAIYTGDCNDICSVTKFLAYMPGSESPKCREFARTSEPQQLRVFYYPTATNEPNRNFNRTTLSGAAVNAKVLSFQERIKSLLLALRYNQAESIFIQFWAPTKTRDGRVMLSVSGQPFGMGNLCNGFCKYRYISAKEDIQLGAGNDGPVGRVFTSRTPEYCASIESYSMEEFPMRDHAKFCGTYVALPVFHCDIEDIDSVCSGPVGVLEFLSRESRSVLYPVVMGQLQKVDLFCAHGPSLTQINEDDGDPLKSILLSLTKKLKSPLVQIWTPVLSNGAMNSTRLFCYWTSSSDPFYGNVGLNFAHETYTVDIGKGLIGKAWEQRKTCFLGETSQLSIHDYPIVHVTRSSRLTSCFAIPLESIGPFSAVVEVYLPLQNNCHHDYVGDVLKSLLSDMAKIPQSSQNFPFQINENKEFCIQYSHSDEDSFLYFDICQKFRNSVESSRESSENGEAKDLDGDQVQNHEKVKASHKRKEVQNIQSPRLQRTAFVEAGDLVIQEPEIGTFPNKRAKENVAVHSNGKSTVPGNDEINRGYQIIVEAYYNGDLAKFFLWGSSGIQELHKELQKRFKLEVDKFQIKYKDDVGRLVILSCDEDLLFHMKTSKSPGQIELSVLPATL